MKEEDFMDYESFRIGDFLFTILDNGFLEIQYLRTKYGRVIMQPFVIDDLINWLKNKKKHDDVETYLIKEVDDQFQVTQCINGKEIPITIFNNYSDAREYCEYKTTNNHRCEDVFPMKYKIHARNSMLVTCSYSDKSVVPIATFHNREYAEDYVECMNKRIYEKQYGGVR